MTLAYEAAESRAYSDLLQREENAALDDHFRKIRIAEEYVSAWMRGQWQEPIECFSRDKPLAELVSQELCDVPDNPLFSILYIVRDAAYAGDPRAVAVIKRMAEEHAESMVELSS